MVTTVSHRTAPLGSVCAALLLAGCATVQSRSTAITAATDRDTAGVTYFLPQRLVKVTATMEPVDLAKLIKSRDAAAVDLAAAREVLATTKKTHARAKAVLDAMPEDATGRDGQESAVAIAKAELDLATVDVADLVGDHDKFEAAVRDTVASGAQCTYDAKLELLPIAPDPEQMFIARLRHNWLRDDTATLKVSSAGLLTSGNAVAADRTGDILVEAAGVVGISGGPPGGMKSMRVGDEPTKVDCSKGPRSITEVFDPVLQTSHPLPNDYPFTVVTTLPAGLTQASASTQEASARTIANGLVKGGQGALFYRSAAPVTIVLKRADGSQLDASVALLPQAGPIGFVPMNSSAFVKTTDDVQFVDGSLTSWSTDRPSEVLEVVRLPVKIATALVSVPAQLLSVKVDYSSKAKSLAEAQQAQIETQLKLQKLKLCLAQADGAAPDKCLAAD
jgi:hypothetical protein